MKDTAIQLIASIHFKIQKSQSFRTTYAKQFFVFDQAWKRFRGSCHCRLHRSVADKIISSTLKRTFQTQNVIRNRRFKRLLPQKGPNTKEVNDKTNLKRRQKIGKNKNKTLFWAENFWIKFFQSSNNLPLQISVGAIFRQR